MKKTKLLILLFAFVCVFQTCFSQVDTKFWFAAPEVTSAHGDRPILLVMTPLETPSDVLITQPANMAFVPISIGLPANSVYVFDMTSIIDDIENFEADVIANKGLLIETSTPISAYYEVAGNAWKNGSNNSDIFTLKGDMALGTHFLISAQNQWHYNNRYDYDPIAYRSFDIVATEDNTQVTITPSDDIVGHPAGTPFTITLDRGQTYSARVANVTNLLDMLEGSEVTSDKPIAVTLKNDSQSLTKETDPTSGGWMWDLLGDQTVPVERTGKEYIAVRGTSNQWMECVYVMATENNTTITFNGTSPVTLNKGQTSSYCFSQTGFDYIYIEGDKDFYAYQMNGIFEMGAAVLPPTSECTGANVVGFSRTEDKTSSTLSLYLTILIRDDGTFPENDFEFYVDGVLQPGVINGTDFSPAGASGWKYARKNVFSSVPEGSAVLIKNPSGLFHLGELYGHNFSSRFGYMAGFNTFEAFAMVEGYDSNFAAICSGVDYQMVATGGTQYIWTPATDLDDPNVPNPILNMSFSGTRKYVVEISNPCQVAPKFDTITIQADPQLAQPVGGITNICYGDPVTNLSVLVVPGAVVRWYSDPQLLINLQEGTSNTFSPTVTDPGSYTYYVTQANPGTGCESEPAVLTLNIIAPATPSASADQDVCEIPGVTDLTATSSGGTLKWYEDAALTSQVGTGSPFDPGFLSNGNYKYYVTETDGNGCESLPDTIAITVKPPPAKPLAPDSAVCESEFFQNQIISGEPGAVFKWFADEALTNQKRSSSNTTFNPNNNLSIDRDSPGTYQFYVNQTATNGCVSDTMHLTYIIKPKPNYPELSIDNSGSFVISGREVHVCNGDTAPLFFATPNSGGDIYWFERYDDDYPADVLGSGNSFQSYVTSDIRYTAREMVDGCLSDPNDGHNIFLNFEDPPSMPSSPNNNDRSACVGDRNRITINDNDSKWYADAGLTSLVFTGRDFYPLDHGYTAPGVTSFYVTRSNQYFCESPARDFTYRVVDSTRVIPNPDTTIVCVFEPKPTLKITAHPDENLINWYNLPGGEESDARNDLEYQDNDWDMSVPGVYQYTIEQRIRQDNGTSGSGMQECMSEKDTITLIIEPCIPPLKTEILATDSIFCASANNLSLDGNPSGGSGTYVSHSWTGAPVGSLSSTSIQNPTFTLSTPGTYTLTYEVEDNNGTTATDNISIEIVASPTADAGTAASICEGSTYTLSGASASNYSSIEWTTSGTGSFNNVGVENPLYTPSSADETAGSVILTMTSKAKAPCTDATATMTLTIVASPTAEAGSNTSICSGDTYKLTGASATDFDNVSWATSGNGTFNNATSVNPIYTPGTDDITAGTVTLTLTANANTPCSNVTDFMVLTINEPPTVTVTKTNRVCNTTADGSLINFDTIITAGDNTGTWIDIDGSGATGPFTLKEFEGVAIGSYRFSYVTNTAVAPCVEARDTVTIIVEDCTCPSVAISSPDAICNGSDVLDVTTLELTAEPGSWSIISTPTGNNPATLTGSSFDATGGDPGTYTLRFTLDAAPVLACPDSSEVDILIGTSPTAEAGSAPDVLDCLVSQVELDGTGSSAGAEFTYIWTTIGGNIVSGSDTRTPTIDKEGIYTLKVKSVLANCTATDDVTIVADTISPVVFIAPPDILTCVIPQVIVNGTGSSAGADYTYLWTTTDGNIVGSATGLLIMADQAGDYHLQVTDTTNGCSNIATGSVEKDINFPEAIASNPGDITCVDTQRTIDASASSTGAGFTYAWSTVDGNIQSGHGGLEPIVDQPGTYKLIVINTVNSCEDSVMITIGEDKVFPVADAGNAPGLIDCKNTSLTLDGNASSTGAGFSYSWTALNGGVIASGATTQTPEVTEGGNYEIEVTNTVNGCSSTDTVTIVADNDSPEISLFVAKPNFTCEDTSILLDASGTGTELDYLFTWTGPEIEGPTENSDTIWAKAGGVYTVEVENRLTGCTNTKSETIQEERVANTAGLVEDQALCNNEAYDLNNAISGQTTGGIWLSAAKKDTILGGNLRVDTLAAGDYLFVYKIDTVGSCPGVESDPLTITVTEYKSAGTGTDTAICSDAYFDLNSLITDADAGGQWEDLSETGGLENESYFNANGVPGAVYKFKYVHKENGGCPETSATVEVTGDMLAPFITCGSDYYSRISYFGESGYEVKGEEFEEEIEVDEECGFFTLYNSFNDSVTLAGAFVPGDQRVYWIAKDGAGNKDSCYFDIDLQPFEVPNIITPNEDGHNDSWDFDIEKAFPGAIIKVFSRWGEVVYVSNPGYADKWDGKVNGKLLPVDSYHYVIMDNGEEVFQGHVTIIH